MTTIEYGSNINLKELRGELVTRLAVMIIVGAYVGGVVAMIPVLRKQPYPFTLLGLLVALLGLGILVRVWVNFYPQVARHLLVWGLTALLLVAMGLFSEPWLPFAGLMLTFICAMLVSGAGFFTGIIVLFFVLGWQVSEINLYKFVTWDDFDTKMQTMIAAGTPPDVWSHWGPSGFADYVIRGLAADMTPYIEKDNYDLSDFIPEVLDIYTLDGKIYGLPMLTTGSFIFYNRDLFDAAGVDYPPTDWDDTAWTYDAFVDMCGELTNDTGDPETTVFGCMLDFWPNDQYAWLYGQDLYPDGAYQTGFADEAYLDSEAAIKGFQARQDMVYELGYMADPATADALSAGGGLFESGKVAMRLTGGWGWWNFPGLEEEFNWAVAALPYGGPDRRDVVFTDPWMMSAKTDHPDEAWEFLKFLVSPEQQRIWMELVKAPPARISLAEGWYSQFPTMTPEEVEELHLGALKHGRESPNHLLVRFDQLNQVVGSALDPVFNNEAKAADVLPAANAELESALQQIKAEYSE